MSLSETHRELFLTVLQKWGAPAQVLMFQEEIGELMTAIAQFSRGRVSKDVVAGEMADARIMIAQMEVLCEIDPAMVEQAIAAKLTRLMARASTSSQPESP